MSGLAVALTVAVAVFFLGMGLYGMVAPDALIRPFGIAVSNPVYRSEVRAVYGGFGVAVAGVLMYAVLRPEFRTGILLTVAVALCGMAAGRVISAIAAQRTAFYPNWFYFFVELILAGFLVSAVITA